MTVMQKTEEIKTKVVEQLAWDSRIDASRVAVAVSNGTVTLKGRVPSYTARRVAEEVAGPVAGVVSVDNQLVVEPPSSKAVSDQDIRQNAQRTLDTSADFDPEGIKVAVDGGRIVLEGTVRAYWEKVTAATLVEGIAGVIDVDNRIAVVPTETIDDALIADEIVHALDRNARTDASAINVKVENGSVTLSGFASDLHAEQTATSIARHTAGVRDIVNHIEIQ